MTSITAIATAPRAKSHLNMVHAILQAGDSPVINPSAINSATQAATTAGTIIQNYVSTVLNQADLSLPDVLPNLPEHQKNARTHATNWRDTVQPQMISTNTDIVDFSNTFSTYFDPLAQLATQLQNNPTDPQAIANFKTGLQQLQAIVTTKQTAAAAVVTSLSGFTDDLGADARNFASDFQTAEATLAGKDGQIAALGKQIDAIHEAMNKDLTMIAAGSVAAVVGGLMIAVGALAEIETAGASTALIIGGLAVVGAGAGVAIAGGVDYSKQTSALGTAITQKTTLQQQYAATKQVNSTVQNLSSQASAALTAAGALLKGWQTLGAQFVEFQGALDRSQPDLGFFLMAQLNAAKKDWDDLGAYATKLLAFGQLSTQTGSTNAAGQLQATHHIASLEVALKKAA
jgi:non-hemolytic enterotoxin B/C